MLSEVFAPDLKSEQVVSSRRLRQRTRGRAKGEKTLDPGWILTSVRVANHNVERVRIPEPLWFKRIAVNTNRPLVFLLLILRCVSQRPEECKPVESLGR